MCSVSIEFEVRGHQGYFKDSIKVAEYYDEENIPGSMRDFLIKSIYTRHMCKSLFRYIFSVTNARPDSYTMWWYNLVYSINALTTTPTSFLGGGPLTLQNKVCLLDEVQVILNAIKSARVQLIKEDTESDDVERWNYSLCATMPDTEEFYRICNVLVCDSKRIRTPDDEICGKSLGSSSSEENDSSEGESCSEEGEELGVTSSEEDDSDNDSDDDSDDDVSSDVGETDDEADKTEEESEELVELVEPPAKKPRFPAENVDHEQDEFEDEEY